jgi:Protein of unknown function (DUF4232)
MLHVKGLFSIRRAAIATASALALGVGAVTWATSPASAAVSAAVKPADAARCATSAISVWVDAGQSNGAAGTIESALEFTNIGAVPCTLIGYPGVTATSATGKQLGDGAGWNPLYPARLVTIPAGGTAHADLFWSDGEVFTSGCKPTQASLLKVYPPNSSTAKVGFFDLPVCTLANHHYLSATVIRSGPRVDA